MAARGVEKGVFMSGKEQMSAVECGVMDVGYSGVKGLAREQSRHGVVGVGRTGVMMKQGRGAIRSRRARTVCGIDSRGRGRVESGPFKRF